MNEKMFNRIVAAFVFIFSFIVYFSTMAPTVSFWDCGEFIACSYRLAVPHPPGAPLYLLVGRIFTLLPIFADIARRVNFISTISSALTVMLLYLIIVMMIKNYLKEKRDGFYTWIPYIAGAIGALTFAFTNSFWFNAVEAEVYAPSMLFTALVVWLILKWSEKSEEIGNEKYLLVIAYLIGLSIGVHLLNVLALPMVFMIIYYKRYPLNIKTFVYLVLVGGLLTGMVYPGMVQGIPLIAEKFGFFGVLTALIIMLVSLSYAVRNQKHWLSLGLAAILLITIGYSSYMMIYIRSNLDPNIDENDPETIERFISYLKREQYGEHTLDRSKALAQSQNRNLYTGPWDFFIRYQVNKMYIRYFLWNFVGKNDRTNQVDPMKLLAIPFLLGLIGSYHHFQRDWKYALAVFALFFMTGLAIILYLNQPDPQPRERDYSYVGSFFAFSIWVGIGAAAILEKVSDIAAKSRRPMFLPVLFSLVLFFISPVQTMIKNYHEQSRTGNYVAWDYSYNMLISCEPNGIIYTNGDNDTFPLWYLQEVENIRTDVRVANLSLLNTSWYIKQLKHKEPKVPILLKDSDIDRLMPMPWKKKTIRIDNIPRNYMEKEFEQFRATFPTAPPQADTVMQFELGPKIFGRYLRVQDYMVLHTLIANRFRKPMYFAVTCASENMLDGLRKYLRMDGLVFKITTVPNWALDPNILYDNLMNKFQYRNLNNPKVYYNNNIIALLQNYRSAFIQLMNYYASVDSTEKVAVLLKKMDEVIPPDVIPITNRGIKEWIEGLRYYSGLLPADSLRLERYGYQQFRNLGEVLYRLRSSDLAKRVFEEVAKVNPKDNNAKAILINLYEQTGEYGKAIAILEEWLQKNPQDKGAQKRLDELKAKMKQARNQ